MDVIFTIVSAMFGAAVGSFLNVCIDRLPVGKSILRPPSHCDSCQHPLSPADLVPLLSYLYLRRRCHYCGALIPWRPFWVELGTALLFALSYWFFGPSVQFAVIVFYGCLFLVIGVIDLEHQLILNKISYPAMALALVISIFQPPPGFVDTFSLPWPLYGILNGITGAAIGLVYILIVYFIYLWLRKREGFGIGDFKLVILMGLVTGSLMIIVAITLGALIGSAAGIILLLMKKKKWLDCLPFGTFLAIATMLTIVWGNDILSWYLGLLRF
jgi:leader peptidase (prepilin peptidase)/N-methyltransferase